MRKILNTFYFASALPDQTQKICDDFNAQIVDMDRSSLAPFKTYPKAELGMGFSGSRTIVVWLARDGMREAYGDDFDLKDVVPVMQGISEENELSYIIK